MDFSNCEQLISFVVFLLKQVNRTSSSLNMTGSCKIKVIIFQHNFPQVNGIYPVNSVIM